MWLKMVLDWLFGCLIQPDLMSSPVLKWECIEGDGKKIKKKKKENQKVN